MQYDERNESGNANGLLFVPVAVRWMASHPMAKNVTFGQALGDWSMTLMKERLDARSGEIRK